MRVGDFTSSARTGICGRLLRILMCEGVTSVGALSAARAAGGCLE